MRCSEAISLSDERICSSDGVFSQMKTLHAHDDDEYRILHFHTYIIKKVFDLNSKAGRYSYIEISIRKIGRQEKSFFGIQNVFYYNLLLLYNKNIFMQYYATKCVEPVGRFMKYRSMIL